MKNKNLAIVAALVIVGAIVLAGVLKNNGGQHNDKIRIGVILSQTGTVGEYGQHALHAVQLGVEEINSRGGLNNLKIEITTEDAKSEPKESISAYQKIVSTDGIKLIIGDLYSSTSLAMAPLAEKDKVVLLAPGASNPKFRDMGDYIFRNWVSDNFDGQALADYAYSKLKANSVSVIYQQVDYTTGLANAFRDRLMSLGGRVPPMETVSTDAPEARQVVAKILSGNPSTVYVCASSKETGSVVKYLRENKFRGQILANLTVESPEFRKLSGGQTDGIIFSTPAFDPDDATPRIRAFAQSYEKKFGTKPDAAAGHAYDAVYIMAEAIKKSKSTDPTEVKNTMYTIKDFPGVTGTTTFDDHGDVTKNILIKRLSGEKGIKLEVFVPKT